MRAARTLMIADNYLLLANPGGNFERLRLQGLVKAKILKWLSSFSFARLYALPFKRKGVKL
jgi:hypothetical protein